MRSFNLSTPLVDCRLLLNFCYISRIPIPGVILTKPTHLILSHLDFSP